MWGKDCVDAEDCGGFKGYSTRGIKAEAAQLKAVDWVIVC